MKPILILFLILTSQFAVYSQQDRIHDINQLETNKEIARNFYQDLWFTNNTEKYIEYVADEYVVHDIFERKGLTEPAIEQKNIADMFWQNGELNGKIDYQIAEGDLVATRWQASLKPNTFFGKILGMEKLASIKVLHLWPDSYY